MIVKIINCTLGLGLVLFIATTPVISRQPTSANETFARVAMELGVESPSEMNHAAAMTADPAGESAATESVVEDEDYADGCLIEEAVYETF